MTWGNRASITFTLVSFRTYRQASHIQTPADDELNAHPKYPVRMWNMTGLTHSKMIMTNLTRPTQIFWEMTEAVRWSGLIIIFFNHYCWIAFHKTLPEINLLPWWGWKLLIPSQFSFDSPSFKRSRKRADITGRTSETETHSSDVITAYSILLLTALMRARKISANWQLWILEENGPKVNIYSRKFQHSSLKAFICFIRRDAALAVCFISAEIYLLICE